MIFSTKMAIAVAEDLEVWQKLNIVSFLTSGIVSQAEGIIGRPYRDASGNTYSPLCVQPVVILKSSRERLASYLNRANTRGIEAAVYIDDMFATGHDEANRLTVGRYETGALPLVGIGLRGERKQVDKIFKGARLHE